MLQTIGQSLFFFTAARGGLRSLAAINVCVYRKALRLSVSSLQQIGAAGGTAAPATPKPAPQPAKGGAPHGGTTSHPHGMTTACAV